jgi:hypothetical protein
MQEDLRCEKGVAFAPVGKRKVSSLSPHYIEKTKSTDVPFAWLLGAFIY